MKKSLLSIAIVFLAFFCFIPKVSAGSLTISASSTSTTKGGTVTITVKANGLAGKFSITSSNGNVLSGGTSSVWLENESKSFKFSANSLGSAKITVTPIDVADSSTNGKYSGSKSININVVKPREKSTNNDLKNLTVEGYSISPNFSKDNLEYTVELESTVEKIKVNADKADSYSSVNGTGEHNLVEGDNIIKIVVTSETGVSKTYQINAIVKDNNPIEKKVGNKDLTVVKRESSLTKPEGFEPKTISINDVEIPAFYNEKTNTTLVGLKDDQSVIKLYIYNSKDDTYSEYKTINSKTITVISKENTDIPSGYKKTSIKTPDGELITYQYKNNKETLLIYGTNLETGKDSWYSYNTKEQTLQIYNSELMDAMEKDFDKKIVEYKLAILTLIALTSILAVVLLVNLKSKSKLKTDIRKLESSVEELENKKENSTKSKKQK